MSGTNPDPRFGVANVTQRPSTTALGLAVAADGINMLAAQPLPTSAAGWILIAAHFLGSLAGIFG